MHDLLKVGVQLLGEVRGLRMRSGKHQAVDRRLRVQLAQHLDRVLEVMEHLVLDVALVAQLRPTALLVLAVHVRGDALVLPGAAELEADDPRLVPFDDHQRHVVMTPKQCLERHDIGPVVDASDVAHPDGNLDGLEDLPLAREEREAADVTAFEFVAGPPADGFGVRDDGVSLLRRQGFGLFAHVAQQPVQTCLVVSGLGEPGAVGVQIDAGHREVGLGDGRSAFGCPLC